MATGAPPCLGAPCLIPGRAPGLYAAICVQKRSSRGDELIPLANHVVVLVHHRVPALNGAHAVLVRTAVTYGAGLLEQRAIGRLDVLLRWLALHPVRPLIGLHVGLCR